MQVQPTKNGIFSFCKETVLEIKYYRDIVLNMQFTIYPLDGNIILTVGDVAADNSGKIPPQAIIILSTIWEMRWIVLCTNIIFSLLLTKSITDFVEWLQK